MNDVHFLNLDDARDLVERISERTKRFNHTMSENEKEVMADLLSDIGVRTKDLININNLADNYSINAEIVSPEEVSNYDKETLEESLFQWEETDGTHYCLNW